MTLNFCLILKQKKPNKSTVEKLWSTKGLYSWMIKLHVTHILMAKNEMNLMFNFNWFYNALWRTNILKQLNWCKLISYLLILGQPIISQVIVSIYHDDSFTWGTSSRPLPNCSRFTASLQHVSSMNFQHDYSILRAWAAKCCNFKQHGYSMLTAYVQYNHSMIPVCFKYVN